MRGNYMEVDDTDYPQPDALIPDKLAATIFFGVKEG
jgi:hypothetical protein